MWTTICAFLIIFFWEEIKTPFVDKYNKSIKNKDEVIAVERLARVKMLSDSAKDIENFISQNVKLISDQTMNELVSRLESIKSDKIIEGDNLKSRIDSLSTEETVSNKKMEVGKA